MKFKNVTKPGERTAYKVLLGGTPIGEVKKLGDRWFIPGAIGVSACEIGTYKTRKAAAEAVLKDLEKYLDEVEGESK